MDAYYPELQLAVEYRRREHTQSIPIMDRKMTVCGVDRGTQRSIYDQRRRDLPLAHGMTLVELSYADFAHNEKKHLRRHRDEDRTVIRRPLARTPTRGRLRLRYPNGQQLQKLP